MYRELGLCLCSILIISADVNAKSFASHANNTTKSSSSSPIEYILHIFFALLSLHSIGQFYNTDLSPIADIAVWSLLIYFIGGNRVLFWAVLALYNLPSVLAVPRDITSSIASSNKNMYFVLVTVVAIIIPLFSYFALHTGVDRHDFIRRPGSVPKLTKHYSRNRQYKCCGKKYGCHDCEEIGYRKYSVRGSTVWLCAICEQYIGIRNDLTIVDYVGVGGTPTIVQYKDMTIEVCGGSVNLLLWLLKSGHLTIIRYKHGPNILAEVTALKNAGIFGVNREGARRGSPHASSTSWLRAKDLLNQHVEVVRRIFGILERLHNNFYFVLCTFYMGNIFKSHCDRTYHGKGEKRGVLTLLDPPGPIPKSMRSSCRLNGQWVEWYCRSGTFVEMSCWCAGAGESNDMEHSVRNALYTLNVIADYGSPMFQDVARTAIEEYDYDEE